MSKKIRKTDLLRRIEALEAEVATLRVRNPFVGPVPAAPLPPASPHVPGWPPNVWCGGQISSGSTTPPYMITINGGAPGMGSGGGGGGVAYLFRDGDDDDGMDAVPA